MSWTKFWLLVVSGYTLLNFIFALIYMACGSGALDGSKDNAALSHFWAAFFFSAQTISTVGYGHISPIGMAANSIAALESMMGLLAFALATGLLYGRFSRPSAEIKYSKNLLVSPYLENGRGLMFRLANRRRNILLDLEIEVIFSYNADVNGRSVRQFFPLELERKSVSILTMNWTIVHPLTEDSPVYSMSREELDRTEAGFAVLLKAFDETFSQTVHSRTVYQANEMIWGAKFKPVFDRDPDGRIVLDLSKINEHELLPIAQ
jgi:inward rectifier potassium channel